MTDRNIFFFKLTIMRLINRLSISCSLLLLAATATVRADAVPLDTDALATLAVQDHGRKKPFTTFARETLLTISGRSSLPVETPPIFRRRK